MCVSACGKACSSSTSVGLIDSVCAVLAYGAFTFVRRAVTCSPALAMRHPSFVFLLTRKEEKLFNGGRGVPSIKDPKRNIY